MKIDQIGPAACRSYVVSCERSGEAVLVDPLAEDAAHTLEHLDKKGLKLRIVVDTHTHADHLSGGPAIAVQTGVPYALHAATRSGFATQRLADGERIAVGDAQIEVIHTPGHTPDSITLRAGRDLLTGDFLFLAQDGAGRLDFQDSDPGAHWDSLQKLASLGDDHRVLPGHDYNGFSDSMLGTERHRNPRFQRLSREEYIAWQRAVAQPTPDWMLAVLAANLGRGTPHGALHAMQHAAACSAGAPGGGACSGGPGARVPTMLPQEAARRLGAEDGSKPFLLDVREPFEYSGPIGRHAPGAYLVPLQQVPQRLGELPADKDAEILVICKSGGRSARACEFLIAQGRRRVFNVAGGTDEWVREGLPVEK